MEVKSYIASDMKQAMDAARRDLGPDAVLLSNTPVRQKGLRGIFGKPKVKVVFAYDSAVAPSLPKSKPVFEPYQPLILDKDGNIANSPPPAVNEKLDKRMDKLEETLTEFMNKFDIIKRNVTYDFPEEIQVLLGRMIDEQVMEELALLLAKETEKLMRERTGAPAAEILEHLLVEQFGRPEPILHKKFTQKVILVMGPTGVGKTTTIVKLAANFAIKERKKVGIINTDTYRVGAQEQLQTYADILGVPIQLVYYPDELAGAMQEMSDRDLIFVDTAGKKPGDEQHKEDLLQLVRELKPEDILLCLSATTSFASIKEMVDTYGFIDDYRLLITKLDETRFRGSLLNISWYTHRPIAYVTTGQNVPDDIEVVDIEKLAGEIIS